MAKYWRYDDKPVCRLIFIFQKKKKKNEGERSMGILYQNTTLKLQSLLLERSTLKRRLRSCPTEQTDKIQKRLSEINRELDNMRQQVC